MIICENCKSNQPDGTIFCNDCGTLLATGQPSQTQKFVTDTFKEVDTTPTEREKQLPGGVWVSLQILDGGHVFTLFDRPEYSIGRLSENQAVKPDIDLSPYKAFEYGVSRMHLVVKHLEKRVIVMDLGSSNGTYINGFRVMPRVENPVRHGDILALGKLKMQVLFPEQ